MTTWIERRAAAAERSLSAVLAALASCAPASTAKLAAAVGICQDTTRAALTMATERGLVVTKRGAGRTPSTHALTPEGAKAAGVPDAHVSGVRRLQGFMVPCPSGELGAAHRKADDCARYDDCMSAHAKRYSIDARCPRACRWYEPAAELRATDYMSTGRSCMATDERAGSAVVSRVVRGRETRST